MSDEPRTAADRLAGRKLAYLLLTFPLGLAYFTFLSTGFSVGVSLTPIVIGIPILIFMLVASRWLGMFERRHAAWALGKDLPPEPELHVRGPGFMELCRAYLTDLTAWKSVAYLFAKFIIGNILIGLVAAMIAVPLTVLLIPLLVLGFLYVAQPAWKQSLDKALVPMLRVLAALPNFMSEILAQVTLMWFGDQVGNLVSIPSSKPKHDDLWRERKRKLDELIGDDGEIVDFPVMEEEKQKRR